MSKINRLPQLAYEYKHIQYEPLMLQFNMLVGDRTHSEIARICGVTAQTLRNWRDRKTKRPSSSTLRMAYKAIGYTLKPVKE